MTLPLPVAVGVLVCIVLLTVIAALLMATCYFLLRTTKLQGARLRRAEARIEVLEQAVAFPVVTQRGVRGDRRARKFGLSR